jgi:hypothetical protein
MMVLSRFSRLAAALMLSLIIAMAVAGSAETQPQKKKPRRKAPAERRISVDASLTVTYDDNIINYSDADLDLFATDPDNSKFALKSKDDWIFTPGIVPRIRGTLFGDRAGWIDLGFRYYAYASNDIRSYSRYSITARQYATRRLYGEVGYTYIPSYYYRNVFVGSEGGADIYREAEFAKYALNIGGGYNFAKGINAGASYFYLRRSYDGGFYYRNTKIHGIEGSGSWRVSPLFRTWSSFSFERAMADGADLADSVLDVSYEAREINVGARHYMTIFRGIAPEIYSALQFRNIAFQTDRLPDIRRRHLYYFGRQDDNIQLRAGMSWKLPYRISGNFEYAFARKISHLPDLYPDLPRNVEETTEELEDRLDYSSNSVTLRFSRRF